MFPICEECENAQREYFCEECEQFFCDDCDAQIHRKGTRKLHNRKKLLRQIEHYQVLANFLCVKSKNFGPDNDEELTNTLSAYRQIFPK
jgi:B-box zinc finger